MGETGSFLPDRYVGARKKPITVTWKDEEGSIEDLSGCTITARLQNRDTDAKRDADGVFALVGDGSTGQFTWTLGAEDVGTAGSYYVQFKATVTQYELSPLIPWKVIGAI